MSNGKATPARIPRRVHWSKGAVLVMDALGVKGSWARSSPDELVASWKKVMALTKRRVRDARELLSAKQIAPATDARAAKRLSSIGDCTFQAMSDTLVIVVEGKQGEESLHDPLFWLALMTRSIFIAALRSGVYFRGVMSCGEFYGSPQEKLIIGPAVDEAVEWYARPDWIGVSTAPSAFFVAEQMCSKDSSPVRLFGRLARWSVPMHHGQSVDSWVVDWPPIRRPPDPAFDEKDLLALFAAKPIGYDALSKYTNTLAFFRSRMAEQQKQANQAKSSRARCVRSRNEELGIEEGEVR